MNFTSLANTSSPSFLTTLKDQKKIPSLSYSYTAGAKYRLKQVYGQLVFSGYDTSRFRENSVSFSLAEDITRDLVVVVQSISYSGSNSATLLNEPIEMFIDSTDPNIWLPEEACEAFEEAFGLQLDEESGLYLVNDTHRNRLLDSDAQVSFRLSDVRSGGDTVTIVLPYAAFDLTAEAPLVANTSHYFPLRRANSSSQYTLGRTFLQEAYVPQLLTSKKIKTNIPQLPLRRLRTQNLQPLLLHLEPRPPRNHHPHHLPRRPKRRPRPIQQLLLRQLQPQHRRHSRHRRWRRPRRRPHRRRHSALLPPQTQKMDRINLRSQGARARRVSPQGTRLQLALLQARVRVDDAERVQLGALFSSGRVRREVNAYDDGPLAFRVRAESGHGDGGVPQ